MPEPKPDTLAAYATRILRATRKERLVIMKAHAAEAPDIIAKLRVLRQNELADAIKTTLVDLKAEIDRLENDIVENDIRENDSERS